MGRKGAFIHSTGSFALFAAIALFLLITPYFASASKTGHMLLLAATEGKEKKGSIADLYIEIIPGTGKVYIDTFPLTKLDTQISTRFAKQVACDYIEEDCSKYDFFYTIRSDSAIIGGPSAGSALAILTITVLKGWSIDEKTAITGTINSGGFIGSVGGIAEKLEAAHEAGLTKVLIPKGDSKRNIREAVGAANAAANESINEIIRNENENLSLPYSDSVNFSIVNTTSINITDETKDLNSVAKSLNITLIEVASLDSALMHFTGKEFAEKHIQIKPDDDYTITMKAINSELCSRADSIREEIMATTEDNYLKNNTGYNMGVNFTNAAMQATENDAYYSSASFCFRASIEFRRVLLIKQNRDYNELSKLIRDTERIISSTANQTNNYPTKTLTDLQTRIIVSDRLIESEDYLKDSVLALENNSVEEAVFSLAYAIERHYSAVAWSRFFGTGSSKGYVIDKDALKQSCTDKLSEAEERYQFAILYLPGFLSETRKGLDYAYADLKDEKYELCLYKASRAKAESDSILSLIGINDDVMDEYFDIKMKLIEKAILKEQEQGNFPILGYSYYEYSKSLKEQDMYSAQLFSEYALELSNLGMYFKNPNKRYINYIFDYWRTVYFITGIFVGVLATIATLFYSKKTGKNKYHSLNIKIKNKN